MDIFRNFLVFVELSLRCIPGRCAPVRGAMKNTAAKANRADPRSALLNGADQAGAYLARFSFCFSLRGGSLNRRAALPPRMLCLAFSDRNGRSEIVDGRSKSQCG